jgi:arylsulfatase
MILQASRAAVLGGAALAFAALAGPAPAVAADQPNIVVIMGDDIGMWNIGVQRSDA